ncbi:MAG: LysM peptidoglycan-binding domain-containing protein, partial [Patescibacteria group bacterium]
MKIALFTKPSIIKVCFSLLLFVCVIGQTNNAYAGFFSDLITKVFGSEPQTLSLVSPDKEVKHNSQNVPLLESSINPDLKNMKDEILPVTIIEDEALISNVGPLGPSLDLGKYASSEKIDTYIVKSGDTLEGIAKKFKISKSTILYSNADLKSSDLLKIGQSLTILPIEGVIYTVKKGDTLAGIAKKYNAQASDISEYNILTNSALQVGDSIVIPGGKITEIPEKVAVAKVEKKEVVEKK